MRTSRFHLLAVLAAVLAAALAAAHPVAAQSLMGSRASIDRMYSQARSHDATFHRTAAGIRLAVDRGELVRLPGNADYRLHGVSHPYVLPATRTFVERLAAQYRARCGERLVVTSAARPQSLRLANSTDRSVHPTGMAVDLRRPTAPRCLAWLRETLLHLERAAVVEATEERRPPHFHVAVYPGPYRRYVQGRGGSVAPSAPATHRVRQGETLWSIARRHNTSVDRLRAANEVRGDRIVPGQVLVIPRQAR
jgi:nucleoid-associated protein YgaU